VCGTPSHPNSPLRYSRILLFDGQEFFRNNFGGGERMSRHVPWSVLALLFMMAAANITSVSAQPPSLTAAQMRDDLTFLRDTWAPLDRSFSVEQRRAFDDIVAETSANADQLTPAEFGFAVSRALAVSHNGHTEASFGAFCHFLPIRLWWFADGLYIVKTHPQFSDLLGARVEGIGKITPEQALARAAPFISGTDDFVRLKSATFLPSLELLHHLGAIPSIDKVKLKVRLRDGTQRVMSLGPQPSNDPDPSSELFSQLIPSDPDLPRRWPQVLDRAIKRPLIYQQPTDLSYEWLGADPGTLYLRSNRIFGTDHNRYELMEKLIDLLQNEIAPRRPKFVIVDLRLNLGGDFFNTITFAQALPKLVPRDGRVFVLVGPSTFSAALVTAAMLKVNGGDRVTLAGEPMGNHSTFWSEGRSMKLPNSGIFVTPAKWMWDWSEGCQDPARCYWADIVFGSKNVSLEPQLRVTTTFADYSRGHDPVLDTVLAQTR
jgi:hypothetical protein